MISIKLWDNHSIGLSSDCVIPYSLVCAYRRFGDNFRFHLQGIDWKWKGCISRVGESGKGEHNNTWLRARCFSVTAQKTKIWIFVAVNLLNTIRHSSVKPVLRFHKRVHQQNSRLFCASVPCSLIHIEPYFRGTYCLHNQGIDCYLCQFPVKNFDRLVLFTDVSQQQKVLFHLYFYTSSILFMGTYCIVLDADLGWFISVITEFLTRP